MMWSMGGGGETDRWLTYSRPNSCKMYDTVTPKINLTLYNDPALNIFIVGGFQYFVCSSCRLSMNG